VRRSTLHRIASSFLYSVRSGRLSGWPAILRILVVPVVNGVPGLVLRAAQMPPATRKLLGNIETVRGNDYTQDRVTPLHDYFATHSFEENLAAAAQYVDVVRSLWSVGIGDPYYNFLFNAGVYADGSVTQMDVADLILDGSAIRDTVRRQLWHLTGLRGIRDEHLRRECAGLFNDAFTLEALLERWPSKIEAAEYTGRLSATAHPRRLKPI
jgi:hypothetical protein